MNTALKVLIGIMSFFGGLFIFCLLVGMVMSINSTEKVADQKSEAPEQDIFETIFINSCIGDNEFKAKRDYCQCSFNYMVSVFGREGLYDEVGKMENGQATGRLKEVMTEAVNKCLN